MNNKKINCEVKNLSMKLSYVKKWIKLKLKISHIKCKVKSLS